MCPKCALLNIFGFQRCGWRKDEKMRHLQIETYFIAFCWTARLLPPQRNEGLRFRTVI